MIAGDHGLHGGITLDDAGQQGAFVHVVKTRGKLQGAGEVLDDFQVGGADQFDEESLIGEDEIAEFVGTLFVELVAFHGGEHGAEDFGAEDVGEGIGPLFGQPEQQITAGLVLADEAGEKFLQAVEFSAGNEGEGDFARQLGRDVVEGGQKGIGPAFGTGILERLQSAAMFGRGHQLQNGAHFCAFLEPEGAGGQFALNGRGSSGIAHLIANKDGLQGHGRLCALVGGNFRVQGRNHFFGRGVFVVQVGKAFQHLMGDVQAGLQSFGGAEFRQETILQGNFFGLVNYRLGLFERDLEMAVFLQFAFGSFPPFFPIVLDDIRDEGVLDLIHRGAATKALQDQFDQVQMVQGGHLAEALNVRNFAGVDVVAGNGLEGFGGEGQVHGMSGLGLKINDEPGENGIHGCNLSKPPTAMVTVAALCQGHQGIHILTGELSGCGQFFKLFFHGYILASHNGSDIIMP